MIPTNRIAALIALHLVLSGRVLAQNPQTTFTDFHIHTSFKNYYREINSAEEILKLDASTIAQRYGLLNWQPFAGNIKKRANAKPSKINDYDQASFAALGNTQGSLLCTSLYPYEKQFTISFFKRLVSHLLVTGVSMKRLKTLSRYESYPFREFMAEYKLLAAQQESYHGQKVIFARDQKDLQNLNNGATVQILTVEGADVLYGPHAADKKQVRLGSSDLTSRIEIDQNIESLRTLPHKVFFLTPGHFTDNKATGFCKTIDRPGISRRILAILSQFPGIRASFFTKFGEGIHGELDYGKFDRASCNGQTVGLPYTRQSPQAANQDPMRNEGYGKEIYRKLLVKDHGASKRILIDVKHMDIQARFEYYKLLATEYPNDNIPIIASHCGVSGENRMIAMATGLNPLFDTYRELYDPATYYKKQFQKDTWWKCFTSQLDAQDREKFFDSPGNVTSSFNPFENINTNTAGWFYPWSINLCDEEIALIYQSRGIIGINFDKRILGGYMNNYQKRGYYKHSKKLYQIFINSFVPSCHYSFDQYWNCEPMLRNIFYIVSKSGCNDRSAWDRIAFGSDFDGLIEPIKECITAADIPKFQKEMKAFIPIFWELNKSEAIFEGKDLMFGNNITTDEIVSKLFFENGRHFILNNF